MVCKIYFWRIDHGCACHQQSLIYTPIVAPDTEWPHLDFKMNEVKQQKLSQNAMLSIVVLNRIAGSVMVGNFRQLPSDLWLFSRVCRVWMSFHDHIWRNGMISDCTPSSIRTPLAVCECVSVLCGCDSVAMAPTDKKILCENETKRTKWKKKNNMHWTTAREVTTR